MQIPEHLVEQMAHFVGAWDNIPEGTQKDLLEQEERNFVKLREKSEGRAERQRPSVDFAALEEEARSKGWQDLSEVAKLLDCRWDSVLGWCEKAGVEVAELVEPGREARGLERWQYTGLYPDAIEQVKQYKDASFAQAQAADDQANAQADAQYEQHQKDKAERKDQQDKDQAEYRERVQRERLEREAARQERLATTREHELRTLKLKGARKDVRRLTRNRLSWPRSSLTLPRRPRLVIFSGERGEASRTSSMPAPITR